MPQIVLDDEVTNEHGVLVEEIDVNPLGRILILRAYSLDDGEALAKTVAEIRRPGVEDIVAVTPNMDWHRSRSYLVVTRYHGVE